jgi:TonB family protein
MNCRQSSSVAGAQVFTLLRVETVMGTYKSCALVVLVGGAFVLSLLATSKRSISGWEKPIPRHETTLWKTLESDSKFVPVPRSMPSATCEFSTPPEPLTTPFPLIDAAAADNGLTVSFVIGADGLVHSALLLKSAGNSEDRAVLKTVRSWRYRPALCNGVPTETEATVDFSSRRKGFGLE